MQRRKNSEDVCHITKHYKLTSEGLATEWIQPRFPKQEEKLT